MIIQQTAKIREKEKRYNYDLAGAFPDLNPTEHLWSVFKEEGRATTPPAKNSWKKLSKERQNISGKKCAVLYSILHAGKHGVCNHK